MRDQRDPQLIGLLTPWGRRNLEQMEVPDHGTEAALAILGRLEPSGPNGHHPASAEPDHGLDSPPLLTEDDVPEFVIPIVTNAAVPPGVAAVVGPSGVEGVVTGIGPLHQCKICRHVLYEDRGWFYCINVNCERFEEVP